MLRGNADVGLAHSIVGSRLNVLARRPFIDKDGRGYVLTGRFNIRTGQYEIAGKQPLETLRNNATALLQYDEWKDIDRTVIEAATLRMRGINDLRSAGLTHGLGSIGMTVSLWDRISDMTEADIDMSAATSGMKDTPAYAPQFVPVPIVHKEFQMELRRLMASREHGESLDITAANIAGRKVAEKSEAMLFLGQSSIEVNDPALGAGTIYGYTTHPDRNLVDMSAEWHTLQPDENAQIVDDVMQMQQASRNNRYYGPWVLYIPSNFEAKMDEDYRGPNSSDTRTVRERIMALSGIQDVRVADFLPDSNVVLVTLQRDVVDLAIAQDISTVQWSITGGMVEEFKVMAVWVPRIKSDFDGRSGITHLRPVS
jgi:uncharacterized linocin/CFP29 family protein